jgi:hypothetical protein
MRISHYQNALLIYLIFFSTFIVPYSFRGEIIAPHLQDLEIAAPLKSQSIYFENRKFTDFSHAYIPEISGIQEDKKSGILTLWNSANELGRPFYHLSGFSPAYPLSWLLSKITSDPFEFITILTLGLCFTSGLFVLALCRELELVPIAGVIAASSLATSPLFMYWLTFPMFPAVWCWSAGVTYSIVRLARKRELWVWTILVFSIYSLLMTAYPQAIIFNGYIIGGYGLLLTYRYLQQSGFSSTLHYIGCILLGIIGGVALALPTYLDLAYTTSESARVAPELSFFTTFLPTIKSPKDALQLFSLSFFPEIFGNPIAPNYPFTYDGLSLTPVMFWSAACGFTLRFRSTWGWWLAILLYLSLSFYHPLYILAAQYLGFGLSPSNPLGAIMLPLIIVVAYGVDALLTTQVKNLNSRVTLGASIFSTIALIISVGFALGNGSPIRWSICVVNMLVFSLLAVPAKRLRPAFFLAALAIVSTYISFPLMLRQDPTQIVTTSPLVEKIRINLPEYSRFAIASPGLNTLPPNLNASLDLPSVHTYNSLSSRRYHKLIKSLGGEASTYGRWNAAIAPDYDSTMFWMSNIAVMLSPAPLNHPNLEFTDKIGDVYLHRVKSHMGDALQIFLQKELVSTDSLQPTDPRQLKSYVPKRELDQGDYLTFSTQPDSSETLLLLSQKFHRDWQAKVLTSSGWQDAETIPFNEVFQGVWLPAKTQKVDLRFLPWVRFAWIAHLFWSIMFLVIVYQFGSSRLKAHVSQGGS